ncbi:MAG: carboxypeptidase-like regulatory domain-containing protein [Terracidiphilus sp.]
MAVSFSSLAQEPDQAQSEQPTTLDRTPATLHGIVRNASTGQGLPRALVRVEGDADTGALTDGEGRFEIPNIPVGPQAVEVRKPGFRDLIDVGEFEAQGDQMGPPHNVMVAAEMPDVQFTLAPAGAIRGQVELSTGDAAEGITLNLAQRTIQEGRAVWQQAASTKTKSDGSYRFGLLAEGDYAVSSDPAMDSDLDSTPGGTGQRWGYAGAYYPDAREPSGITRIHVSNGQETQANLSLTLEPFHAVTAAVLFPQGVPAERAGANLSAVVLDNAGRQLPYQAQYDEQAHSVQAELPDGSYTLLVSSIPPQERRRGQGNLNAGVLAGSVEVTVAGRAVANLRIALSAPRPNPVQLIVQRNATSPIEAGLIEVQVSQSSGWIDDSMVGEFASGAPPGPLETVYTKPGSYWVHTHNQRGLCEVSFTAGGANLAREPVILGLSGSAAPMQLTLRDDCASLQLSLPDTLDAIAAGEEPYFTVYAIPDFDSTSDVAPVTLRASTGGSVTLSGLTPGNYHVYTFAGAVAFAYWSRDALAALASRGQAIALSPGATGNLVVEAPGQ